MREESSKIDPKKLEAFEKKLRSLAKKELGKDEEGDARVQIVVVDRTRFRGMHFLPVPYDFDGQKSEREAMEMTEYNLGVAHGEWDTACKIQRHRESDDRLKKLRVEWAAEWKKKYGIDICSIPDCRQCARAGVAYHNEKKEPVLDQLGFLHYDQRCYYKTDVPTTKPKKVEWSGLLSFRLRDRIVEFIPDPSDKNDLPYGIVFGVSKFEVKKVNDVLTIAWSKPKFVAPMLDEELTEIIRRPWLCENPYKKDEK